jgi:isocitrate dehydrogenase
MLVHIGQGEVAAKIHNAWLCTLEDGIHTGDIYKEGTSNRKVGTQDFATAVIERLGKLPSQFRPVSYQSAPKVIEVKASSPTPSKKELVGVDIFLDWKTGSAQELGEAVSSLINQEPVYLRMIANRGVKVYPNSMPETFCSDHWRCRLLGHNGTSVPSDTVPKLLTLLNSAGFDTIKTENLYNYNGEPGYSILQGE